MLVHQRVVSHSPGVSQGADVPGRPGRDGVDGAEGAERSGSLVASREVDLGFHWPQFGGRIESHWPLV